jgi:hypothetical protein
MKGRHYTLRFLRRWHARFGVVAVVFFLLLAVSGITLNHGGALRLEGRKFHLTWLARWYGLRTDPPSEIYHAGDHSLAWGNGMWLLDGEIVAEDSPPPVGMIELSGTLYVADADALLAYTPDYRLIEKITAAALPAVPIGAIGVKDRQLWLKTSKGIFASADSISWQNASASQVEWSVMQQLPSSLQRELSVKLVPGVSVMQLIADIHSGRILGKQGPLLADILGLLLIAMGLSGGWVFLRSRRRRR